LLLGVVVYIVFSPRRVVTFPIMLAFAVIFSVLVAFLPAFLGAGQDSDVVSARIATIADVNHDESAIERSQEIQDSIQEALSDPIGSGLGTIGSAAMISSNLSLSHGTVLDSGYLARLVELGWLGFVGYLFVAVGGFATILWSIFSRGSNATQSAENKVLLATAAAMCAALVWADAAGDAHLGVEGVFFWIAMGIGLRSNRIQSISDEGADVKDASLPKFRNLWVAATR
jgi:putative inorganic carbon (HCO3(-)) transporter